jgi:hypothetical protein
MFSLTETNAYYLCTRSTDLRKGFNRLAGVVGSNSCLCLPDGSVYIFIFINRSRTTLKLLHWERGGFVIYHKRLEEGRISASVFKYKAVFRPLRRDEPVLLVEGINPNTKRRKRYYKQLVNNLLMSSLFHIFTV